MSDLGTYCLILMLHIYKSLILLSFIINHYPMLFHITNKDRIVEKKITLIFWLIGTRYLVL